MAQPNHERARQQRDAVREMVDSVRETDSVREQDNSEVVHDDVQRQGDSEVVVPVHAVEDSINSQQESGSSQRAMCNSQESENTQRAHFNSSIMDEDDDLQGHALAVEQQLSKHTGRKRRALFAASQDILDAVRQNKKRRISY